MGNGWIAVDLDGTLAHYDGWVDADVVGEPIPEMVERVRGWLAAGRKVKIFTARVSTDGTESRDREVIIARSAIGDWCEKHLGQRLEITNIKDSDMIELWDDRAVQVISNTGVRVGYSTRGLDK